MPRASRTPKLDTFNFRVDPDLKTAFTAATEAEDRPAAQVLRAFMRDYVKERERAAFVAEAQRQSRLVAAVDADPDSEPAQIQRELDANFDEMFKDDEYSW